MKCPECGCEFSEDEAEPQYSDEALANYSDLPTSYHCPMCDATLSARFARRKNTEKCACSATVDRAGDGEVCSSCGNVMFNMSGPDGIEETHAVPSPDDVERLDAYDS